MLKKLSKILLFGPSGFFGPIILKKYPDIKCTGRSKPPKFINNKFYKFNSINNLKVLDKVNFDKVIFLIGNSDHHNLNNSKLNKALSHNFEPLVCAFEYFKKRKIKKVITFSGALIYDTHSIKLPVDENQKINGFQNNYIFSKHLAENLCSYYKKYFSIINVRLSNIYGPTDLVRPDIVQSLVRKLVLSKDKISVWSKKPVRDFIFAEDAAEAVVKLLFSKYDGHVNLGSGKMTSIKELCDYLEVLTNKKIYDKKIKNLYGHKKFVYNIKLIKKIINWGPQNSLRDGLSKTLNETKNLLNIQ